MINQVINLHVDEIQPSPFNPRKHFAEGAIAELANSIRQVGVQQPVIVRVVAGEFELVFGHRRLKAAKLAGLTEIPAIEREYSDDQVLEVQIVENSQREDVHPLDEADGFKALIDRGYTIARIADRIGRTPAFVAARLQLVQLCKKGREIYDAGNMSLGAAIAIARVPAKLQIEVIDHLQPEWRRKEGHVINAIFAQATIRDHFMLILVDAPFDGADPELVKKAGACTACPKRSGNQPELFADLQGDDLCTDPSCLKSKCDAVWKRIKKDPSMTDYRRNGLVKRRWQ